MKTKSAPGTDSSDGFRRILNIESFFYILLAAGSIFVICLLVFGKPRVLVSGMSMYPTFENGDYLKCSKMTDMSGLEKGDVIVFKSPEKNGGLLIKRLIAVAGDTVYINEDGIYVNGRILADGFPVPEDPGVFEKEVTIPDGSFVAIGDNRNHSRDCRAFGPVSEDNLKYKVETVSSFNLLSYFSVKKGE